jgi:hypothetical protein
MLDGVYRINEGIAVNPLEGLPQVISAEVYNVSNVL